MLHPISLKKEHFNAKLSPDHYTFTEICTISTQQKYLILYWTMAIYTTANNTRNEELLGKKLYRHKIDS